MKKIIYFFTLILISNSIFANEEWFEMGRTDESRYYLNVPSVKETNVYGKSVVQSWVKMVIFNDISKDGLSVGDYSMLLYQSNCDEETLGIKSITDYKKDRVFGRPTSNSYVQMKDVLPNSIGKAILEYSCAALEYKKSE